jgi:hypothetical protein
VEDILLKPQIVQVAIQAGTKEIPVFLVVGTNSKDYMTPPRFLVQTSHPMLQDYKDGHLNCSLI